MIGRNDALIGDLGLLWSRPVLNVDPDGVGLDLPLGEVGAAALAAQDTNVTKPVGTHVRLRVGINTTNATGTGNFQLEYREVGAPKWQPVEVR